MAPGDVLRCGIVDVGMTNEARIEEICNKNGIRISLGKKSSLYSSIRPSIDLILAVPRPLRLEKLMPIIASMGVGKVVLIQANKVPKDYFGELSSFHATFTRHAHE
jgi:16S rRNA U1498 N3-methylase RsmE